MKISRRKPRCVDGNVPLGRCGSCSAVVCQEQKKTEKENPICFTQVANYRYYSITPHTATAAKKKPNVKHSHHIRLHFLNLTFWVTELKALKTFCFKMNAQKPFKNSQFLLAFLGVNLIPIRSATCEGCKSDLYVSLLRMSNATR